MQKGTMTKPAQILALIFGMLFIFVGLSGLNKGQDESQLSAQAAEGIISYIDCPRKYSPSIRLDSDSHKFYLANKFRDVTGCIDDDVSNNLIGKKVSLTYIQPEKVLSLKLNNQLVFSVNDVESEAHHSSLVILLIGCASIILLLYRMFSA
jgi:hypothetical protein